MSDLLSEKEMFLCNSIFEVLSNNEATSLEGMHALLSCFISGFSMAYGPMERVQFEEAIRCSFDSAIRNAMRIYDGAKGERFEK